MLRFTGISGYFSHFRAVSAGAIVLATILSCSDSTSPTEGLDGVIRINVASVGVDVPDSLKQALALADQLAGNSLSVPMGPVSRNLLVSASAALSSAGCGSGGGLAGAHESK